MNKILELRQMRANLWNEAKIYLDTHRQSDGCLSDVDQMVYEKMESDVVKLGKEIKRLESQAHIDRDIVRDSICCTQEKENSPVIRTKVEFIESYIKIGNSDYQWNDNHGELIRCRDCKKKGNSYLCILDSDLEEHGGNRTDEYDDWFCADGERK